MIKKLITLIAMVVLVATTTYGQWSYAGVFPPAAPDTVKGQAHGLTVDPDGKVWVTNFGAETYISGTDTIPGVRLIRVYNPDGTPAAFSPIGMITVGGVTDTLFGSNSRGLRADGNGNILYVDGGQRMYQIDYTNGQGLGKVALDLGTSPTAPAVDDNGTIFVGPVVPGNPIKIFDPNLNYLGNALDATIGFSRAFEVSGDGNTIYWAGFTNGEIYVYNRPDEFSPYDSVGTILEGFHSESLAWNPKSGCLWASAGSFNDLPTGYTPGAWYAYDFYSKAVIDSFTWQFTTPGSNAERPRAIDFSPDGDVAYVGVFGGSGLPLAQKFVRDVTPATVTFNCNMNVQIASNSFDPATGTLWVAGTFNGWAPNGTQMLDGDGDGIYSADVPALIPGNREMFKFVKNADGWEGTDDRQYVVGSVGNTYSAYWEDDLGGGITISTTFLCNMELEIVSGRFDPATDVLSVRGSFNGWGATDLLAASATDPTLYETTLSYAVNPGETINYKFAYDLGSGGTTWENDPNKEYTYTQNDINAGFAVIERGFNNLTLDGVTANEATITFTVDMTGAVNAQNNTPFGTIENVFIAGGAAPLAWPQGGWPDEDSTLVLFLNDSGLEGDATAGDQIWSKNVVFPQYTQLGFDYKYGANWGTADVSNDNEATTGVNHSILMPRNIVSARAVDTWADMSPTTLEDLVVGVEELSSNVPNAYTLEQNYPNPFNPATTINFSIREAGVVSLRVFDLLGQEVATLLNEEKSAGTYQVNFDASKLTSGIYIYTVTVNDFSASKKMMLVK